jgi:hypothetical protein
MGFDIQLHTCNISDRKRFIPNPFTGKTVEVADDDGLTARERKAVVAEDYWMATSYCERFMHTPAKTLYILVADLHDTSPNEKRFVNKMEFLLASGIKAVTLLAISDQGLPSHNEDLAGKLAKLGMPCFGCIPDRLPDLLAAVLKGADLKQFAEGAKLK